MAKNQIAKASKTEVAAQETPAMQVTNQPTRGILIIACGNPYYGRMAHNLAVSIKLNYPDTKIALAHAGRAIDHIKNMYEMEKWFDQIIPIPDKCFYVGEKKNPEWIKTKLHLPELSPWDYTIFLDADMLWLKVDPAKIFEDLKNVEFMMNNNRYLTIEDHKISEDHEDFMAWADVDKVVEAYELNDTRYYSIHSEMIYFKKTDAVLKMFAAALDVYENPKVNPIVFAGGIPDEFAFEIAMAQCKLFPHVSPFRPVYWEPAENRWLFINEVKNQGYAAYSVAGNNYSFHVKNQYDHLISAYFGQAGLHHVYLLRQKSDILPERIEI